MSMPDPLIVTRRIAAPPSRVYRYLTESDLWAIWQGMEASLEASPGGDLWLTMPGGQIANGQFVELVPETRIVFSWGWVGHPEIPPGSTTVEIELTWDGDGTLLTLTHTGLPPSEIEIHRTGWQHYVPRLATASEGGEPGPDTGAG
jgi:uncharacterized protein YndB with AHSA1/START domain